MSQRDVIIACDFSSAEATLSFLDKFTDCKPFVKIGMELYYAAGPAIVRDIKARGHKIFLDLIDNEQRFFSLKLEYEGDRLASHTLEF